jgi:hypothetical protein
MGAGKPAAENAYLKLSKQPAEAKDAGRKRRPARGPAQSGSAATNRPKAARSVTGGPWPGRIMLGWSAASLRIERRFSAGS